MFAMQLMSIFPLPYMFELYTSYLGKIILHFTQNQEWSQARHTSQEEADQQQAVSPWDLVVGQEVSKKILYGSQILISPAPINLGGKGWRYPCAPGPPGPPPPLGMLGWAAVTNLLVPSTGNLD